MTRMRAKVAQYCKTHPALRNFALLASDKMLITASGSRALAHQIEAHIKISSGHLPLRDQYMLAISITVIRDTDAPFQAM